MDVYQLEQIVDFPTRGSAKLDLILTDIPEYCNVPCHQAAPLSQNDHCAIMIEAPSVMKQRYRTVTRRPVTTSAKISITASLASEDFHSVFSETDVDDKVNKFHDIIDSVYQKYCPVRNVRVREQDPVLVTPLIIKLRRAKNRLYKQGSPAWKFVSGLLSRKIREKRKNFSDTNLNAVLMGSKKWWKNVKTLTQPPEQTGPSRMLLDNKWITPSEFVEQQNDYFLSVTSHIQMDTSGSRQPNGATPLALPSVGEVKARLRKLDTKKATHSKDFPSWISKENAEDIAIPLTDIIQTILTTGKYPAKWKSAEIIPLNKVKNPQTPKDFRPISLLWHCGKVAEYFIVKEVKQPHIYQQLNNNQYAYTQGRGTTDALVHTITDWGTQLDNKDTLAIHALFIDFSKAFDMMRKDLLINKMEQHYMNANIISVTDSFLSERTVCVVHKQSGSRSTIKPSVVGVPQGTLLGPVLWNIFVDDLQPTSTTVKYADDTTIYNVIKKLNITTVARTPREHQFTLRSCALQDCMDQAQGWSENNSMMLNASKTKSMLINLRDTLTCDTSITVENTDIECVNDFTLLGVTIDNHLRFDKHIDGIVTNARMKTHGIVTMKKYGLDSAGLVRLYTACVRPVLCYAAPAWYSYISSSNREKLEQVQRQCLQIVFPDLSYTTAIETSNIPLLNDYLNNQCKKFVTKVASRNNEPLNVHLPEKSKRPIRMNKERYISRKNRTSFCSKNVFYKCLK